VAHGTGWEVRAFVRSPCAAFGPTADAVSSQISFQKKISPVLGLQMSFADHLADRLTGTTETLKNFTYTISKKMFSLFS
jgi:hypothetical protein